MRRAAAAGGRWLAATRCAAARALSTAQPLSAATRQFLEDSGASVPVLKGPMYPGSNPELVAAVSEAGGLGVVQPISLTHLYGHDFREGLQLIKSLTSKPFGVNFTILENAKYKRQMDEWMHIAAEEGVKFFLTSLGKPDAFVAFARPLGIKVYHDVHTPAVAAKVARSGVDGLVCLNDAAGGQTGNRSALAFAEEVQKLDLGLPLLQAGGVADAEDLRACLDAGYAGASVGTRFLASPEAQVTESYKRGIVAAAASDIVWTNKLAGTNSSVISTPQIESGGLRVNALVEWLLRNRFTKLLTRTLMLQSAMNTYKKSAFDESVEIWQAGTGVERIHAVEPCADIVARFGEVARI